MASLSVLVTVLALLLFLVLGVSWIVVLRFSALLELDFVRLRSCLGDKERFTDYILERRDHMRGLLRWKIVRSLEKNSQDPDAVTLLTLLQGEGTSVRVLPRGKAVEFCALDVEVTEGESAAAGGSVYISAIWNVFHKKIKTFPSDVRPHIQAMFWLEWLTTSKAQPE